MPPKVGKRLLKPEAKAANSSAEHPTRRGNRGCRSANNTAPGKQPSLILASESTLDWHATPVTTRRNSKEPREDFAERLAACFQKRAPEAAGSGQQGGSEALQEVALPLSLPVAVRGRGGSSYVGSGSDGDSSDPTPSASLAQQQKLMPLAGPMTSVMTVVDDDQFNRILFDCYDNFDDDFISNFRSQQRFYAGPLQRSLTATLQAAKKEKQVWYRRLSQPTPKRMMVEPGAEPRLLLALNPGDAAKLSERVYGSVSAGLRGNDEVGVEMRCVGHTAKGTLRRGGVALRSRSPFVLAAAPAPLAEQPQFLYADVVSRCLPESGVTMEATQGTVTAVAEAATVAPMPLGAKLQTEPVQDLNIAQVAPEASLSRPSSPGPGDGPKRWWPRPGEPEDAAVVVSPTRRSLKTAINLQGPPHLGEHGETCPSLESGSRPQRTLLQTGIMGVSSPLGHWHAEDDIVLISRRRPSRRPASGGNLGRHQSPVLPSPQHSRLETASDPCRDTLNTMPPVTGDDDSGRSPRYSDNSEDQAGQVDEMGMRQNPTHDRCEPEWPRGLRRLLQRDFGAGAGREHNYWASRAGPRPGSGRPQPVATGTTSQRLTLPMALDEFTNFNLVGWRPSPSSSCATSLSPGFEEHDLVEEHVASALLNYAVVYRRFCLTIQHVRADCGGLSGRRTSEENTSREHRVNTMKAMVAMQQRTLEPSNVILLTLRGLYGAMQVSRERISKEAMRSVRDCVVDVLVSRLPAVMQKARDQSTNDEDGALDFHAFNQQELVATCPSLPTPPRRPASRPQTRVGLPGLLPLSATPEHMPEGPCTVRALSSVLHQRGLQSPAPAVGGEDEAGLADGNPMLFPLAPFSKAVKEVTESKEDVAAPKEEATKAEKEDHAEGTSLSSVRISTSAFSSASIGAGSTDGDAGNPAAEEGGEKNGRGTPHRPWSVGAAAAAAGWAPRPPSAPPLSDTAPTLPASGQLQFASPPLGHSSSCPSRGPHSPRHRDRATTSSSRDTSAPPALGHRVKRSGPDRKTPLVLEEGVSLQSMCMDIMRRLEAAGAARENERADVQQAYAETSPREHAAELRDRLRQRRPIFAEGACETAPAGTTTLELSVVGVAAKDEQFTAASSPPTVLEQLPPPSTSPRIVGWRGDGKRIVNGRVVRGRLSR